MNAKFAAAFAAIVIALSVVTLAPTASAAPETPTPTAGSVALCFIIPLGSFAFSICI